MNNNHQQSIIKTPLGHLLAEASTEGLKKLVFAKELDLKRVIQKTRSPVLDQLALELHHYFQGKLKNFTVPLVMHGTTFQKDVWQTLKEVPYGTTITYKQQSELLNNPLAIRAMAAANAKNPLLIIIPCHRIIGSNGRLTGYAGGLERKRKLLMLEQEYSGKAGLFNA